MALERVFPGDSELARRMRAIDWSTTDLGAPESWPAGLRVSLGICLTAKLPTQVVWGPQQTLFYNDACIPLLGDKHPGAVGRSTGDAWADSWHQLGPLIDRAMQGESAWASDVLGHGTCSFSPIFGDLGADGVFWVCHDVNAAKHTSELIAVLGHELRNPLAPMLTALQVMEMTGKADPTVVSILEGQVLHMNRLIADLGELSRLATGQLELHVGPVDLTQTIGRALEMATAVARRSHSVELRLRHGVFVQGDADRLAQVFTNLLHNAMKCSPPGSRIVVRSERIAETVRIELRDEGEGIPRELLERVFDMVVHRTYGGMGIGLAVARRIVEQLGGTIAAQSRGPGQGSTFVVTLPLAQAATEVVAKTPLAAAAAARSARILVVDDNHDAASSLRIALEVLGYIVEIAHDGPEALAIAAELVPDIAILDIGLPDMDGYELARRLREAGDVLLIAVSGYGDPSDIERSRAAGFSDHLVKPIDLRDIARVLTLH